jgi:hypothetical protein
MNRDSMLDTLALVTAFTDNDHEAIDLLLPAGQDLPREQGIALAGLTAATFALLSTKTGLPISDLLRAAAEIVITGPDET